jgi:hypothetical protein
MALIALGDLYTLRKWAIDAANNPQAIASARPVQVAV